MKLSSLCLSLVSVCLVIAAIGTGCRRSADGASTAAGTTRGPKERLDRIVESVRHKIEDMPVGFVVSDGNGRSTMVGTNKITKVDLIAPASAEEHYKAVITVDSQLRYSIHRTKSSDESEKDQGAKTQGKNILNDSKDSKNNLNILDADLAAKSSSPTSPIATKSDQPSDEIVTRRPPEQIRKYELVYDNDRWSLVTTLDPKTEQSLQFAFDEATSSQ
jgi:hypothetical protein